MRGITNSEGTCIKCGESGLFTPEQVRDHLRHTPACKAFYQGKEYIQNVNPMGIISATELLSKEFPNQQWLVDSLLPKKGVIFIGGKRGSMKTWGALLIAISVTRGTKFLSRFDTTPADVLFIDAENGEAEMQKRLKMILGEEQVPPNLYFSFFPKLKLEENVSPLEDFLSEHPGAIVIIDSFRRVLGIDENEAREINSLFVDVIRPLIQEYDATFILLHHLRKTLGKDVQDHLDELRGSSELVNYADAVILFERVRYDSHTIIMRHAKSRTSIEHEPCRLEVEASKTSFRLNFVGTFEEAENQHEKAAKAIQKWIFENAKKEFKTADVQESLKGQFNGKAISRGLKWLVEQNLLFKPKKGLYVSLSGNLNDFDINGQTEQTQEEDDDNGG